MDPKIRHHLNVGREYYHGGEHDKAKPHLEAVVATHDGFADVHNMLGVIHHQAGRPGKAEEAFERALALNPRYTEAALNLAVCYNERGRYDDAKRVYAEATRGYDGNGDEAEQLDAFVRGKIANLHNDLGAAYLAAGLLGRAVTEFRKALELCPAFSDIRTRLATTLRDQGKIDESIAELEAIRESTPDYLPGRIQLGISLWRADRIEEARAEWQTVLTKDPENRSCRVYLHMTADGSAS